jgi:two-component system, cell cycle sensor histidine kinase and response regulator CckA
MVTSTNKTEGAGYSRRPAIAAPSSHSGSGADDSGSISVGESTALAGKGGNTVLVVNDAPDQLELMTALLAKSGYSVLTASNGQEGFEVARSRQPDLIISDISMPVADGIEMCRLVREHQGLGLTPILLVSGVRKDSESVVEALKAGADDFLEAPYDPMRLVAKAAQLVERGRAGDRLLESERRFRQLAENINEVFWIVDPDERAMLYVSPAYEEIWGRTCESLYARHDSYLEAVHPDDRQKILAATWRQRRGEQTDEEYRVVRPDGSARWIHDRAFPIKDEGGRVVRIVGVAEDITERKHAEEEVRRSEQRYRLLFDSNPQPMWVFDLETLRFLEINEAAVHHYGYSREEFLSMTIKDIRPPEDIPALVQTLAAPVAGLEKAGAWKHRKKDGSIIAVEIASHQLTFAGRSAELVLVNDITERKQLEEQLRQSQKMEAVGQLAGGIAHDFNNLLTVINGYSDLTLKRLPAEDPLRLNLEEIRKAGERAASLTRQLLAFSRKQVLQPKVLDLNVVVRETEKLLRRLIGEDIELRAALEPRLGSVKADPGQIEQVLMNLAVNARDAMPRGGKLTIGTENAYLDEGYVAHHIAVAPGRYVMLSVSDTGTGMDEQTQARIFEPFFTTKEAGKGTGLGLSTVYGIVKQSGGHLWVYSEVGRGTTFKVYLPRVDEGAREYGQAPGPVEGLQGTETILLAEDDELVRNMTRIILSDYGYRVLAASNGEAAISICERAEGPIHLLLTDVVMPGMSGRELADRIALLRPGVKVLFMSGYTEDAIVHHGVLDEGVNFLQKPFTPDDLARRVKEVLGSGA